MKRRVGAIIISLVALASLVFAGSNGLPSLSMESPQSRQTSSAASKRSKREYVNMKSDEGWQMVHRGRKIMVVVGHFAAYHNGTVITADSAVRYNDRHIECFGNVLIKRGTTYIYGDRAEYNGRTNRAKVFSKIIKVVDGDATLLTYNFEFNTRTNEGRFSGGGVLTSGDNMLESDRGYVYSDKHEIVCVDKVQMRNDEYEMMSDSVVYNTETNYAQFFTRTNIWNKNKDNPNEEGDYLYADRGSFDKPTQLYTLTLNGYILTKEQELLCDTLYYYRDKEYVRLQRNIQIDDIKQKMLLFGDWGEYWKEPGNVFVTKNPSLISYDTEQGDSVFMRSDSMYVYTRYPIREKIEKARKDSLEQAAKALEAKKAEAEKTTGKEESTESVEEEKQSKRGSKRHDRRSADPRGKKREERRRDERAEERRPSQQEEGVSEPGVASSEDAPQRRAVEQTAPPKMAAESVPPQQPASAPAKAEQQSPTKDVTNAKDSTTVKLSREQERRKLIDSLAKDTTKQGKRVRAKLLKEETAELNRRVKEYFRQRNRAYKAKQAERAPLIKRLLGEASVRDAERRRVEKARAKFVKDSIKEAKRLAKDSLQMDSLRLDSLRLDTLKLDSLKADSLKMAAAKADSLRVDSLKRDSLKRDSLKGDTLKVDSLSKDSLALDSLAKFDTMTVKQVKAYFNAIRDKERGVEERIKQDSLDAKLDRIGLARKAKRAEVYRKWEYRDSVYMAKMEERDFERLRRKLARQERRGIFVKMADSLTLALVDSTLLAEFGPLDTLVNHRLDSLLEILYPKAIPSPAEVAEKEADNIDSLYREIRAYSHVKMFRSDFQSICDSLTMNTGDSIIHMYKSPIMWNGSSQITSEVTHIFTGNGKLVRADFEGMPLTASEIDTAHYNQVTGKEMTAHFRDNEIYRNDVKGNVQTIYYMQEENSPEITLMAYIEAGDMTSYIENQEVVGITYRGNPTYTFYPMDKIPESQPTKLKNFTWEANKRPAQDSVFNRTIRPSQREAKRALVKPLFPINALMQQRKMNYLRRREWRDRRDTLTIETIEWIESLKSYR